MHRVEEERRVYIAGTNAACDKPRTKIVHKHLNAAAIRLHCYDRSDAVCLLAPGKFHETFSPRKNQLKLSANVSA